MSQPAHVISPASTAGWQLWNGAERPPAAVDRIDGSSMDAQKAIMGLPTQSCRTLPLHLPRAETDVLDGMIRAQLEKRGLASAAGGVFSARLVHEEDRQCLFTVDAFTDGADQRGMPMPDCAEYVAAVRLRPPRPGCLVLTEEQGRLVLVAARRGYPVAALVLGPSTMEPGELVHGIQPAVADLLNQGFITPADVTALQVWTELSVEMLESLKQGLPVPVEVTEPPRPGDGHLRGAPVVVGELVPPEVAAARRRRARSRKALAIAALAVLTYAAAVWAAVGHLQAREAGVAGLRQRLGEVVEPAGRVRASAERWRELQPALDPDRFPVVQLDLLARLMPPSGLVITEFETRADRVQIEGTARDAQVAFQFFEDIRAHERLRAYEWEMPQPRVREDRAASFEIQGDLL